MPDLDTDFNLSDDYKPDPLIPQGNYLGNITGVSHDPDAHCITWTIVLDSNGGVMNDGTTPIDGGRVFAKNWLPKPGDAEEQTSDGKKSKKQSKINMLHDFADRMGVNMDTMEIIKDSIANGEWIGIEVAVVVGVSEYQGVTRNEVNKLAKQQ